MVSARRTGLWALTALALLLAGCADPDGADPTAAPPDDTAEAAPLLPEPVQVLDIDGGEYFFTIGPEESAELKPGWTLVRFRNVGKEAHQVMFARVKDGVDLAELAEAGAGDSSGAAAIEYVDMIGGVSYIGADQDTTALIELDEGLVMAMCYVPDAQGVAHALMGMTAALDVSAAGGSAPGSAPAPRPVAADELGDATVVGTIELSADGYVIPEDLRAGWYRIRNTDSVLHEMSLLRLSRPVDARETGVLVEDLAANRVPEVDLDAVGGMGAISPGFEGYLYLDLTPGDYLAVDFMPDPGVPRPHMLDGYHRTFRVA